MREFLEKLVELERSLSRENGSFALFALFLREDSVDKWDLVVAAPWIEYDRKQGLSEITQRIQETFAADDRSLLSRVVIVDLTNPDVDTMNRAVRIQHGQAEVRDGNFFGLQIKHAYIISSEPMNVDEEVHA